MPSAFCMMYLFDSRLMCFPSTSATSSFDGSVSSLSLNRHPDRVRTHWPPFDVILSKNRIKCTQVRFRRLTGPSSVCSNVHWWANCHYALFILIVCSYKNLILTLYTECIVVWLYWLLFVRVNLGDIRYMRGNRLSTNKITPRMIKGQHWPRFGHLTRSF